MLRDPVLTSRSALEIRAATPNLAGGEQHFYMSHTDDCLNIRFSHKRNISSVLLCSREQWNHPALPDGVVSEKLGRVYDDLLGKA